MNNGFVGFSRFFASFFLSRCIIFLAPLSFLLVGESELYVRVEEALGVAILLSALIMGGQSVVLILMVSGTGPDEKIDRLRCSLLLRSLPFALFAIVFPNHNFSLASSFLSLVILQTTISSLQKVNGFRIKALLSETVLYLTLLCFAVFLHQALDFNQNVELPMVIGGVSILIVLYDLKRYGVARRVFAIDSSIVRSGLGFMMTGCTLVIASSFSRIMLPMFEALEDQVIYASNFRFAMVGLLVHQLLAGYVFRDLYRKKVTYVLKAGFFSSLLVFITSLAALVIVDSDISRTHIEYRSLGSFNLTLLFSANISLISILSFIEILMQRIDVSMFSRFALFFTSMIFLLLFWLGSGVVEVTLNRFVCAHSLLLCSLVVASAFVVLKNYRLHYSSVVEDK